MQGRILAANIKLENMDNHNLAYCVFSSHTDELFKYLVRENISNFLSHKNIP